MISGNQDQIKLKDLKNFGFIWAGILCVIGLYPALKGEELNLWALILSFGFALISLINPQFFSQIRFYQGWIKFGGFMGKINSKIIIFFLFYFIFLPTGIILKILRKDLLNKKIDKTAESYFVTRESQPSNMENQF